jgi:CYTH domain-containing protein
VDEFLDRELVIARTTLNGSHTEKELPDWLVPLVEREVSGEDQYLDENLGR